MMAQITATINADQPKPVAAPIAHHNASDANNSHEIPGHRGAGQHAGALAGPLGRLLDFRLGQFDLLAEQRGQILGDLGDQVAQRPVGNRRRFCGACCPFWSACSSQQITARTADDADASSLVPGVAPPAPRAHHRRPPPVERRTESSGYPPRINSASGSTVGRGHRSAPADPLPGIGPGDPLQAGHWAYRCRRRVPAAARCSAGGCPPQASMSDRRPRRMRSVHA